MADETAFWEGKAYSFFSNRDCECFPCHSGIAAEDFNCLFCYCPLYALGARCGGSFTYTDDGVKDCSECLVPHRRNGYGYILEQLPKVAELTGKK